MTANNRKNTRILLFLILYIRMTLTVSAGDFLFTSVNTAQGLSDSMTDTTASINAGILFCGSKIVIN